jgi:hypothetical protein
MFAESRVLRTPNWAWSLDRRTAQVLRYAMGSTIALGLAMAFNWHLAFVTPLLCVSLLASPRPRPSLKAGVGFVLYVAISSAFAVVLSRYLISYPVVYIPLTGLLLLHLFYLTVRGKAPALVTLLLICLLVLPLVVMTSPEAAQLAALGILTAAAVSIGVVWVVHSLPLEIHDHPDPSATAQSAVEDTTSALPPLEQLRTAAIGAIVLFPVFILIYAFQQTELLVVLIFVAVLSSQPEFATNFKIGVALIAGNVMGGACALLLYELLVVVPELPFLLLLTFLAGLFFGTRVFSDSPTAKLFGMAYSTLLLVIGSVTASGTDEASSMVYMRVAQITLAVAYCVMAFGVADRFVRRTEA